MTATQSAHPFVCPTCREVLDAATLACPRCNARYRDPDGFGVFNDSGMYHGPIPPRAEMAEILALMDARGYRHVFEEYLPRRDPDFARYISEPARTAGLRLLGLRGEERVLDFGCAFGIFSRELVKQVAQVVALDVTREKVQFLNRIKQQDGLANLFPVCNGDPVHLPFADGYFDVVILNTVFEYLPRSIREPDLREAHRQALLEFRRILKPRGRLFLSTKNRYGYPLILGGRDIGGLRFTSLLPRRLANSLSQVLTGQPYRSATHSFGEYQQLLSEAGFRSPDIYWPYPGARYPERWVPLTTGVAAARAAVAEIKRPTSPAGLVWHGIARLGWLPWLVPHYTIVAERQGD